MRMDNQGQTALVDAIIFMILMTLASGIILGSGAGSAIKQSEIEGLQQYTQEFAETLLAIEIESPGYIGPRGDNITINGSVNCISMLLCDAAIVDYQTGNQANYSELQNSIEAIGNSLVRPGIGYAIHSHVEGQESNGLFVSNQIDLNEELPDQLFASQNKYEIAGEKVVVTVFTWVMP